MLTKLNKAWSDSDIEDLRYSLEHGDTFAVAARFLQGAKTRSAGRLMSWDCSKGSLSGHPTPSWRLETRGCLNRRMGWPHPASWQFDPPPP